ncbi:hypothetical protein [Inmirania thermothiophila]|uniref:Uncharacterized protein n=1 Tax=Inmirania thermothiophila TaxID=1750597 RepID=A0A3N1Y678_9GAMM|nr:hypothetical protein [Inmirania thermothiophila]ROR34319.1 hypothetical protein EDC57_0215 [Inmirania thermothiophila]
MPAEAAVFALLLAAAPPPEGDEPPPSLELLEFIGSFTAEDGTWVDPQMLATEEAPRPPSGREREDDAR